MGHFRVVHLADGRREIVAVVQRPAVTPEILLKAREAGLEPDDPVVAWLAARCILADSSATGATQLYGDYLRWAGSRGDWRLSQTLFGRQLNRLGFGRDKAGPRATIRRLGLRLRTVRANDSAGS